MKYQDFQKIIESVEVVDEQLYNELINKFGAERLNRYFERYINYLFTLKNNEEQFKRVAIYIEKNNRNTGDYLIDELLLVQDLDLVRLYLYEIGQKPLLSAEQEKTIAEKMRELNQELQEKNITIEKINESLNKHNISDNNLNMDSQIDKVRIQIDKLKNSEQTDDILNEQESLVSLLNDMLIYNGYETLRKELINANLRLVVSVAKKYIGRGLPFQDLIQEGNIGLDKVSRKYDVTKGYRFSTYATWWIRQSITRAIEEASRVIRVPSWLTAIVNKVSYIEKLYENKYGIKPSTEEIFNEFKLHAIESLKKEGNNNPTEQEILEKLGFNIDTIEEARLINRPMTSIYAPIGEDDCDTLLDVLTDNEAESVEDTVINNLSKEYLASIIHKLNLREQLIIILRQGLTVNEYMTFENFAILLRSYNHTDEEIVNLYNSFINNPKEYRLEAVGKLFNNITRERVRQIEMKAFRKLQNISKYEKRLARI